MNSGIIGPFCKREKIKPLERFVMNKSAKTLLKGFCWGLLFSCWCSSEAWFHWARTISSRICWWKLGHRYLISSTVLGFGGNTAREDMKFAHNLHKNSNFISFIIGRQSTQVSFGKVINNTYTRILNQVGLNREWNIVPAFYSLCYFFPLLLLLLSYSFGPSCYHKICIASWRLLVMKVWYLQVVWFEDYYAIFSILF